MKSITWTRRWSFRLHDTELGLRARTFTLCHTQRRISYRGHPCHRHFVQQTPHLPPSGADPSPVPVLPRLLSRRLHHRLKTSLERYKKGFPSETLWLATRANATTLWRSLNGNAASAPRRLPSPVWTAARLPRFPAPNCHCSCSYLR